MANPPSDNSLADFGANEWLVEEMREQYDRDPGSVGPEWAAFFKGDGSAGSGGGGGSEPKTSGTPSASMS